MLHYKIAEELFRLEHSATVLQLFDYFADSLLNSLVVECWFRVLGGHTAAIPQT